MEASEAVQADTGTEQAAADTSQDTGTQEAPAQDSGQDFQAQVMERLDKLDRNFEQPESDPFDGFFDPSQDYEGYDGLEGFDGQEQPDNYQDLPPELQQLVDQRLEEQLAPFQQHLQQQDQARIQERRTEHASRLEQEYPELHSEEGAKAAIHAAREAAVEVGRLDGLPADVVRGLAQSPKFIEYVFLAGKAREQASQETPADDQKGVDLEGGGGASPVPDEEDAIDRAAKAGASQFWESMRG